MNYITATVCILAGIGLFEVLAAICKTITQARKAKIPSHPNPPPLPLPYEHATSSFHFDVIGTTVATSRQEGGAK